MMMMMMTTMMMMSKTAMMMDFNDCKTVTAEVFSGIPQSRAEKLKILQKGGIGKKSRFKRVWKACALVSQFQM